MQPIPVICTTTPVTWFRRHETAKTQSRYHDRMLEHIKVVSKYKHLLPLQEARSYDAHAIIFLPRRMKRLLLDGQYHHLVQYLRYTLAFGRLRTVSTSLDLVLSKLKLTRGGITSL